MNTLISKTKWRRGSQGNIAQLHIDWKDWNKDDEWQNLIRENARHLFNRFHSPYVNKWRAFSGVKVSYCGKKWEAEFAAHNNTARPTKQINKTKVLIIARIQHSSLIARSCNEKLHLYNKFNKLRQHQNHNYSSSRVYTTSAKYRSLIWYFHNFHPTSRNPTCSQRSTTNQLFGRGLNKKQHKLTEI